MIVSPLVLPSVLLSFTDRSKQGIDFFFSIRYTKNDPFAGHYLYYTISSGLRIKYLFIKMSI